MVLEEKGEGAHVFAFRSPEHAAEIAMQLVRINSQECGRLEALPLLFVVFKRVLFSILEKYGGWVRGKHLN